MRRTRDSAASPADPAERFFCIGDDLSLPSRKIRRPEGFYVRKPEDHQGRRSPPLHGRRRDARRRALRGCSAGDRGGAFVPPRRRSRPRLLRRPRAPRFSRCSTCSPRPGLVYLEGVPDAAGRRQPNVPGARQIVDALLALREKTARQALLRGDRRPRGNPRRAAARVHAARGRPPPENPGSAAAGEARLRNPADPSGLCPRVRAALAAGAFLLLSLAPVLRAQVLVAPGRGHGDGVPQAGARPVVFLARGAGGRRHGARPPEDRRDPQARADGSRSAA